MWLDDSDSRRFRACLRPHPADQIEVSGETQHGRCDLNRARQLLSGSGRTRPVRPLVRHRSHLQDLPPTCPGFCAVALGASVFQSKPGSARDFLPLEWCAQFCRLDFFTLLTLPLTVYLQAVGRPDLDVRYGTLGALVNLALTAAFIWVGLYGVVGATALGSRIGSVALLGMARSAVRADIPSFIRPVSALVVGLIYDASATHGAIGLILVSMSFAPGAVAFAVVFLGPRRSRAVVSKSVACKSLRPALQALLDPAHG